MTGAWSTRRCRIAVACLMVTIGVSGAHASSVLHADARGGVGHLLSFDARYDGTESSPVSYLAGTLTATLDGGPAFDAYCVDLYDVLYVGGGGSTFAVSVRPIQLLAAPGKHGDGVGFLYQTFAGVVATDIDRAALQVAIWKVEYDNGGPLGTGHFTVADSPDLSSNQHRVYDAADRLLATYHGNESGMAAWLEATSHPVRGGYTLNQNLLGPASPSPHSSSLVATPEPGTVAAALLGVGVFIGLTLRMRMLGCSGPCRAG